MMGSPGYRMGMPVYMVGTPGYKTLMPGYEIGTPNKYYGRRNLKQLYNQM